MSRFKPVAIASCLGLLALVSLPSLKADEWNKRTIITVNEPLAIPGKVLEPGKYVMRLVDSPADRHIVQVFNENETQLQTTILAIPNYKVDSASKTEFSYWEMPAGQPRALKAWFYPGDNTGQEFAYPKDLAATIAKTNNENVPTVEGDQNGKLGQMTPSGESQGSETQTAQNNTDNNVPAQTAAAEPAPIPAPEPAPAAQAAPQPAPGSQAPAPAATQSQPAASTTGAELPRAASPVPLMGLAGLLSLGGALAVRALKRSA